MSVIIDTSVFNALHESPTSHYSRLNFSSAYLVAQVVPVSQGYPSLLENLGAHLDHLVLQLHPDHPSLEVLEQCIYWIGNNLHW